MIAKYFEFNKLGTNLRTEITAGATTFITMAYIIIVNPKILESAGIPFGPSMAATIFTAFLGTISMGLYAKRPFAIAPYMGQNAFVAYTVVNILGYSWQTALGAIFISGVLFTVLTLLKVRTLLTEAIPEGLKISFAVGIGLFLTFIGLNDAGIIKLGVEGAPVSIGDLSSPQAMLAVFAFLLSGFLMIRKNKGSLLIGIITATVLGFILGVTPFPKSIMGMPPDITPIFLQLDIQGALSWGFFAVILTVFVMDFVDTMGTLIGASYRGNLLDEHGNLPEIEKPFLCDSVSTVAASLFGTTTAGVFIESAAGIEAGGRSGFTSVITAVLFLAALFFAPFITAIPAYAYGSALIIVGMMMISPIKRLNFDDYSELIPAFVTISLMSFSFNIGIGMTAGFVVYPLAKLSAGKIKEVKPGLWALFILSVLFYIFYPY